jgi:hypothetical protein
VLYIGMIAVVRGQPNFRWTIGLPESAAAE